METFTIDAVTQGSWIKIGENGKVFQLCLYPDGRLKEQWLFDTSYSWEGAWEITTEGKQLEILVNKYLLLAISAVGNIYDGNEYQQDAPPLTSPGPYRYKLIHLKDDFL